MTDKEFDTFVEECYTYCMPVLHRYSTSSADIEDAFFKSIGEFWIRFRQGRLTHLSNLPAYVCKMAINELRVTHAKNKKVVHTDDVSKLDTLLKDAFSLEKEDKENTHSSRLHTALNRLGARCKELLIAKYVYHQRYKHLAEEFDYKSPDVAKTQTNRCLQQLRKWFKNT